jgi:glycerol kinase
MIKNALVLDAGTTNIKVLVFDQSLNILYESSEPNPKTFPQEGWVEQNPESIFETSKALLTAALEKFGDSISFLGITNQRESVVSWDRKTGNAISPLIVWEDRRAEPYCHVLDKDQGFNTLVRQKTGLEINPYFSASKIWWIKNNVSYLPNSAVFGTLDSWLVYKLSEGEVYKTDYTNASRTLLYDIQNLSFDPVMLDRFGIGEAHLPQVGPSFGDFGSTSALARKLHIKVAMGDQQASLYAAGTNPGTIKVTLGTGIFPMKVVGEKFELKDGFFTTLAVGDEDQPLYALETMIGNVAARVSPILGDSQKLRLVMEDLAAEASAVLKNLIDGKTEKIIVDGGISQSDIIFKELERFLDVPFVRQKTSEGTALGVAKLLFDRSSNTKK